MSAASDTINTSHLSISILIHVVRVYHDDIITADKRHLLRASRRAESLPYTYMILAKSPILQPPAGLDDT